MTGYINFIRASGRRRGCGHGADCLVGGIASLAWTSRRNLGGEGRHTED